VDAWVPGTSYFGRRAYVEYVPGELPVVISAPHGGDLEPTEIADRIGGTTVTDTWTRETALAVRDAFVERIGSAPHLVISHLERTKLDPNREIVEAAEGDPFAENAWCEFQAFIDTAEAEVVRRYGSGLYVDLHGHGHELLRAELGYLLSAADLARPDSVLDAGGYAARSSIRALAEAAGTPLSELLRGGTSLGGLLAAEGYAAVPSPDDPSPGADPYFTGGYNVERHGSKGAGRTMSGVQVELPRDGVRDSDANRRAFASALARAVETFMSTHWGFFAPSSPAP
jgi:N-formylglutamate amidohydrolase